MDAAPLDVADSPIEEDAALAVSAGIPTVILTDFEEPEFKDTVLSDFEFAQTPLCPIVKVSGPLPVFVTVNDRVPELPGFNPVKVPAVTVTP